MIIKELKLKNFWSHKNTEVKFDKDFYMILGRIKGKSKSNGSGKSTIARGIVYALYGDASPEIINDEAIYNDEKEMSVELSFELNSVNYKIVRNVKRGRSPVLRITTNGEEVKPRLKEGQEIINKILGADFKIYNNTSYFRQGDLDGFSKLTPKEAKEVVIKLLQLDAYNIFEDRAKAKISDITAEVNDTETKLGKLDAMIIVEESRVKNIKYSDVDLIAKKKELKEYEDKTDVALKLMNEKSDKLRVMNDAIFITSTLHTNITSNILTHRNRIVKLENLSGKCPMCEHDITEVEIVSIVKLIEKELEPFRRDLDLCNIKLNTQREAKAEIDAIEIKAPSYGLDISRVSREIGEIESELQLALQDANKLKVFKKNRIKGEAKLTEQKELLSKYVQLKSAFGKNGIQAFIIENVMPEIQATTNEILEGLDTDIRVLIESQKELKKGGKAETLDIKVLTEFGERPYTNYSGGEKTLIDFALRIALSIILTRRSECQIQTLILDEVFGELDTVNKQIISKALRFIAGKFNFKKILIISHAEELQDSFDDVIRVVFDGTESKIER